MKESEEIVTLIKFSSLKYISELQKGKMFMNTLGYFINCESKIHQDNMEGIDILHQANKIISVKIENPDMKPIILTKETGLINFKAGRTINHRLNIFCMYLWNVTRHKLNKIDDRVLKFGPVALIITDGIEFMSRVTNMLKRNNFNPEYQAVEYFDENSYNGDVGVFMKRKSLEYMQEFRISVRANMDNNPYILDIGDISDISVIVNSLEINNLNVIIK